ncbi:MAG: transglycosylase SLT domain-containing protein [Treponema sp.]|nr:transglycosylase SLT domain-containing protein [Treponema sp.]
MDFEHSNLQKLVLGTVAFSVFFALMCVAIFVFLPSTEKKPAASQDLLSSAESSGGLFDSADFFDSIDFSEHPVQLASREDVGLMLYRQPQSRPAVEWFYSRITSSREITQAILKSADEFNIPLSLAFSLAHTESDYLPTAMHVNANGSIDRGLFQLNSNTFTTLTEADFYNPKTSAYYGMSHLRFCLNTAGNEIAALAMYNAGSTKVRRNSTPQTTLNYISKIQNYRNQLEHSFAAEVLAFYGTTESDSKFLAKY